MTTIQGGSFSGYAGILQLERSNGVEKKLFTLQMKDIKVGSHFRIESRYPMLSITDDSGNTFHSATKYQWYALNVFPFKCLNIMLDLTGPESDLSPDFLYIETDKEEELELRSV